MLHIILFLICLAAAILSGRRTVTAARARKPKLTIRWAGWTLLPIGLYMTGLVTLVSRIGTAFSKWVLNLVFNPLTWAGLIVLAVSVVLLLTSGVRLPRRSKTQHPEPEPAI